MNEITENLKIDEILEEIHYLRDENQQLKADNKILGDELTYFKEYSADLENEVNRKERMINGLKLNNSSLTLERRELIAKIQDMQNTRKYLTAEDAGKAFARELLGGA
jgi:chromosome segregation ATPase